MTEEKLNKGGELIKHIKSLIGQKEKWEKAEDINRIELRAAISNCTQYKYMEVDKSFINFEDIKILALTRIQRRIDELQKEFYNL